ncbi:MAG: sensor histidine kinase KdpD [Deltaproteobacteria bacterium]|nr:sensor histidine kinase KdpD [Deltaproteobacteria bacterium]
MTEGERPSPERLLDLLAQEEARRRKGRLKIFFGMAPGVGKTYAMLSEARTLRQEGVDAVIGWVETHGRAETEALADGLERITPKTVPHRGIALKDFDLDAALARHPKVVLVDELAHTNAPGLRHLRRYQDVLELLEAGIDVRTTLNVQHLESLNDIVAGITGVIVQERVPDSMFDRADEVELVDLPTPDLLKRLEEGKVYVPDQARRAMEGFFTTGNLTALRELALRRTAERVHDQGDRWREAQGITRPWATRDKLMVAIGPAPQSANLVRAAYRMASRLQVPWIAVTVESAQAGSVSDQDKARLEAHLALAERLGAEILVLSGDDVSGQVLAAARERSVTRLLTGKPTRSSWSARLRGSPVDRLVRDSGGIDILVTTGEEGAARHKETRPVGTPTRWTEYLWAVAAVLVTTAICFGLRSHFVLGDYALVYVLAILLASLRLSRWPATLTAVLSVAAVDFFFVPPFLTFAVADLRSLVTFLVLLAVGLTVSSLTLRVRREAESARERERRTSSLYTLSRQMAAERKLDVICNLCARYVRDALGCDGVIWVADGGKTLTLRGDIDDWMKDAREEAAARWVFEHEQPAGRFTDTLPSATGFYLPLRAATRTVGVIGIRGRGEKWLLTTSQRQHLEVVASLAATAVDRTRLAKEVHENRVKAETEKLRNDLLSTLSHDLRTPLSSLTGAVALLSDPRSSLTDEAQKSMLGTIRAEAGRLDRLIGDVTELTRLESGIFALKKEWCPVEEVIGSALARLEDELKGREIDVRRPEELVLAPMDAVLIEQVVLNLLENAGKHTAAGTPIDISVEADAGQIRVSVADRGTGIPEGEEERIFEKYHRVMGDRAAPGMGIGLALCKAIVTLHGGSIEARNREDKGAVFTFTLPADGGPPPFDEPSHDP